MTITGPELMILAGMMATFSAGAWVFIMRPYGKRQRRG